MMRPAPQILLLAMLLAMLLPPTGGPDVTPDPGEIEYALSEEENEECFKVNEGAKCSPGRRFLPDGQCALCEDGISYQPQWNRCPKCIKCACEPGHRVKENCTIFKNTVCEPDSRAQSTTTKTPTPSTGNITNATTPAIPPAITTVEMAEHREPESDDERNKEAIALGVLFGVVFIVSCISIGYICKLQKDLKAHRSRGYGQAHGEDPDIGEHNGNQQAQEINLAEPEQDIPEPNGHLQAEADL